MTAKTLQLGLVVDSAAQLNVLRPLVAESGHKVAVSLLAENFASDLSNRQIQLVDAWLVILPLESPSWNAIDDWLEQLQLPVIIDDGGDAAPGGVNHDAWRRRVLNKLQQLNGSINLEQHSAGAAKTIWVLAASTGGPEAVREFFQALPDGLDIGFVYVQHIDTGYEQSLVDMVNRHSRYQAYPVADGDVLYAGSTAIVAGQQWIDFLSNGTVAVRPEKWPGVYSPAIDQVFANMARCFGSRCNVIVFSGMGDDGAAGARLVHQQGGQVWAQQPEGCTVASMPESVIAAGLVSVTGTPKELAAQLTRHIRSSPKMFNK
ncbi:chemotaxis protein CheB [Pseudomaricurvus sp.]|uniref:chemotaxis protein CheB n=1 Tax=Pseudomaricurvus sp. TaxID=2004510 RepID=UPI003F6BF077